MEVSWLEMRCYSKFPVARATLALLCLVACSSDHTGSAKLGAAACASAGGNDVTTCDGDAARHDASGGGKDASDEADGQADEATGGTAGAGGSTGTRRSEAGLDASPVGTGGNGGATTGDGGSPSLCTSNTLHVSFDSMYSAYVDDPTLTFQLPAIVDGLSGVVVKWYASDPSMVRFDPDDTTGGVLITMRRAGKVTINANSNGACGAAELLITAATKADWQAGNARFNNMNPLTIATDPTTGQPVMPPGGFTEGYIDPPAHPPACTNCHGDRATSSFLRAVLPTPAQIGGFSDSSAAAIFTQGVMPIGAYYDSSVTPEQIWSLFHRWTDITGADVKGMIVYLRSLPPKVQTDKGDAGQP